MPLERTRRQVAVLRQHLSERGLDTSGKKAVLVERLSQALSGSLDRQDKAPANEDVPFDEIPFGQGEKTAEAALGQESHSVEHSQGPLDESPLDAAETRQAPDDDRVDDPLAEVLRQTSVAARAALRDVDAMDTSRPGGSDEEREHALRPDQMKVRPAARIYPPAWLC